MTRTQQHPLQTVLENRIAIIDGRWHDDSHLRDDERTSAETVPERDQGSQEQRRPLQPDAAAMICDIHRRFLDAGADIIETNTFGATSITQSEFFVDDPRERGGRKDPEFYQKIIDDKFLNDLAFEINETSARQCREWADRVANATGRQRFVAGPWALDRVSLELARCR